MRSAALALAVLVALSAPAGAEDARTLAAKLNDDGIAALDAGDCRKAVELFSRARGYLPLDPTLIRNLATARSTWGGVLLRDARMDDAIREFRLAAGLEPGLAVHHANLGIALVRSGSEIEGKRSLEKAIFVDPKCAPALSEMGAVAYRSGDLPAAISCWSRAAGVWPTREDLLDALARARREYEIEKNHRTQESAHFVISWDGDKDAGVGSRVLQILEDAWEKVGAELGIRPETRTRVILYTGSEFRQVTGAHEWVGGLFDGRIRIPIRDFGSAENEVRTTILHEYVHVAVASVEPACPAWLNEGLAQHYEGRDRKALAGRLAAAKAADGLLDLDALRPTFTRFADADMARLAYAEGLSFTVHLLEAFGPERVGRFLTALGEGKTEEEASAAAFFRPLAELFAEWRETI